MGRIQMGRIILINYLNSHLSLGYSGHTEFKLVKRGRVFQFASEGRLFHRIAPLYLKLRLR